MLFLLISTLLDGRLVVLRAAISLALAFLVEISQLYHAPWIDSIRQTTLGGLVLGFGFLWTDLVCYSVGIAIGSLTEGDQTLRQAKIGEGFWPLGFADAVLIKRMSGNGDLESSQLRTGVPEGTARVSVATR